MPRFQAGGALAVDRPLRRLLDAHRRLFERVARFASVGIASSLLYALVVAVETSIIGINHDLSTLLAYTITIPFNFLLHRHYTFGSDRAVGGDVARYGFSQAVSMLTSCLAMAIAVDLLHLSYGFGILGGLMMAPVVSYLLLDRWVFAKTAP